MAMWIDDITPIAGKRWSQTAQDRKCTEADERGLRSGVDKGGLKKKIGRQPQTRRHLGGGGYLRQF